MSINQMVFKLKARKQSGNMLFLSVAGALLAIVVLLVGFSFLNLLFTQNQVQKFADEAIITGAVSLNNGNRIGQMNDLIARSRQLVYTSREVTQLTPHSSPDLQMLSQQILDEDRQAAVDLEKERQQLQKLCAKESKQAITDSLNRQVSIYRSLLPWVKMQTPKVVSVDFGNVSETDSSVPVLAGVDDLADYDKSMKYFDPSNTLYKGNINAKLPGDDSDLTFKLCSLPACVNDKVSPARLILADVFEQPKGQQLQSAAKLVITSEVPAGTLATGGHVMTITATATTNGAGPAK